MASLDAIKEYENYTIKTESENSVLWKKKYILKIMYVVSMVLIK